MIYRRNAVNHCWSLAILHEVVNAYSRKGREVFNLLDVAKLNDGKYFAIYVPKGVNPSGERCLFLRTDI